MKNANSIKFFTNIFFLLLLNLCLILPKNALGLETTFLDMAQKDEESRPVYLLGQKISIQYFIDSHYKDNNSNSQYNYKVSTTFHYDQKTQCNAWWLEKNKNIEFSFEKDESISPETKFRFLANNLPTEQKLEEKFEAIIPYTICPGIIYSKTVYEKFSKNNPEEQTKEVNIQEIRIKFAISDPTSSTQ